MNANVRRHGETLLLATIAVPAILTIVAFAARLWWRFELCTHFRAHYLVVLALGAIVCTLIQRIKAAAVFGCLALVNLWFVAPLYLPASNRVTSGESIRMMTVNVRGSNQEHQYALELFRETKPDAILVLEVRPHWADALKELAADYPYQLVHARTDGWGIAFFSRLPCSLLEVRNIGSAELPSIVARMELDNGRQVHVVGSHPPPPMGGRRFRLRNEQLAALADYVTTLDEPVVLLGDLNSTSFSPYFRDLIATTRLRDSRSGFGIQTTWPTKLVPFGLTIDHVLMSPEITVTTRTVGPDIGSDHRPVMAELLVPTSE